jgi:hypothetical protein
MKDMAEKKPTANLCPNLTGNEVFPAGPIIRATVRIPVVPKPATKAQAAMKEEFRQRFFKESERHPVLRKLSAKERAAIKLGGRAAGIALEKKRGRLSGKMVADVVLAFVTHFVTVRERVIVGEPPKTE